MKIIYKYVNIVFVIVAFASCHSLHLPQERKLIHLPNKFANSIDTNTTALIKWKTFFDDPYLQELIDSALHNNLDYLSLIQNIEIAKANLLIYKGLLKPSVSLNGGAGIRKYGNYTQEWAGNKTTEIVDGKIIPKHLPDYLLGLSSSWEIDVWGKFKSMKKAAQQRYLSSLEGKQWFQTILISEIATNYYELMALDEQKKMLLDAVRLQEESLALIKLQKEAGRTNELAVKQFEAQILNSKADAKQIDQDIIISESLINTLLGRLPQTIQRGTFTENKTQLRAVVCGTPQQLLQNRPDIRMSEYELLAARLDVSAAQKSFYPNVTLNAGLALNGFSPTLLFSIPSIAYSLLGGITAPVFNRSELKANFAGASAMQQTALYNYQKTILNSYTEVYNGLNKEENLLELNALKSNEIETLTSAIEFANLLFQNNRANYLEILTAQQSMLNAKIELLGIQKEQKLNAINLYKALGGGWQ